MRVPLDAVRMNSNRLIAGVSAIILLAAVVFVPVPGRGQWLRVLQDFGHAPAFGCIALIALFWIRTSTEPLTISAGGQYFIAFVVAVTLGGLTELAQFVVKRDPSWHDLRRDVMGAAAFLGLAVAFDSRLRRFTKIACLLLAVTLLVAHTLPVITMTRAYERRGAIFPALTAFADRRDLYFLQPQWSRIGIAALPPAYASSGEEKGLYVTLMAGDWPGVDFYEPAPDWRGFRTLAMDFVNPTAQPQHLAIRIHDAVHNYEFTDRFNRKFEVAPHGRSTIRIPLTDIESAPQGRRLDLQHIADFLIFRGPDSTATEFYVVSVRLEK
jgi:hypothetical protein